MIPELKTMCTHRKAISEKRLNICKTCEHLVPLINVCGKCGCFLGAKTLIMQHKCPIGKWDVEKEFKEE